jgi:hypothetical protein
MVISIKKFFLSKYESHTGHDDEAAYGERRLQRATRTTTNQHLGTTLGVR